MRLVRKAWVTSRCFLSARVSWSTRAAYVFRLALLDDTKCTGCSIRCCGQLFFCNERNQIFAVVSVDTLHRSFSQLASSHGGLQDESMVEIA